VDDTSARKAEVWRDVANTQRKLQENVGAAVALLLRSRACSSDRFGRFARCGTSLSRSSGSLDRLLRGSAHASRL